MASKIKRPNFEEDYTNLMSAQNEEEVTECLLRIIKAYSVFRYRDLILTNPLFKMIIPELKTKVIGELDELRSSLTNEITVIETDLSQMEDDPDFDSQIIKLKQLKSDCLLLIHEVDEKKFELENLL